MTELTPSSAPLTCARFAAPEDRFLRTFFYALLAPPRSLWTLIRRRELWPRAAAPILVSTSLLVVVALGVTLSASFVTQAIWQAPTSAWVKPVWWIFEA